MFGNAKIKNSSLWKRENPEFQCLKKPKFRIPIFGKAKIQDYTVWKSQDTEFQSLEKNKIQNSNVWK